jgi:hypothetical protein
MPIFIYKLSISNGVSYSDQYYTTLDILCDVLNILSNCSLKGKDVEELIEAEYTIYDKYPVINIGKYRHKYFEDSECDMTVQEIYVND